MITSLGYILKPCTIPCHHSTWYMSPHRIGFSVDCTLTDSKNDLIQGSRKTGILACPLGKLLTHFAHPGPLLACLSIGWVAWTLTRWASKVLKLPARQDDLLVLDYRTEAFPGLVFWDNTLTGNPLAVYIVLTGINRNKLFGISIISENRNDWMANHLTECAKQVVLYKQG